MRQTKMIPKLQSSFADIDASFPSLIVSLPGARTSNGPLFVRRLISGAGHRDSCIDNPTWEQIASAIFDLDNRQDILLEGQEDYPQLVIGGKHEKYLVIAAQKDAAYYLSDPSLREQEPSLIVLGGQASEYEADLCVGSKLAMRAIWWFTERGMLFPPARWLAEDSVL